MNDLFQVESLGQPTHPNPLDIVPSRFVVDHKRLAFDPYMVEPCPDGSISSRLPAGGGGPKRSFELAGPREKLFFEPQETRVAIVSCGGLCPGINAVIRALVMQLWYRYGCRRIWGVRFGYQGLSLQAAKNMLPLVPDVLTNIHETGGSILGSSRGTPPSGEIVAALQERKINILFTIGGDGTMRGALAIAREARNRDYRLAVIGIPKTIDNDIPYVRRSFGFETAVAIACESLQSAHTEASGYPNGIGLVKLMGRHSGYIAASAALANGHANFVLVPEVPFSLEGEGGLLQLVEKRLQERQHALIVAAEGAGQLYFQDKKPERDASGNLRLGDIGLFLKEKINTYFQSKHVSTSVKYIDPSYLIRAAAANPADQLFCARLAQNATHAAMAGKTATMIGYWHGTMTHVPLAAIGDLRQSIDPAGDLWFNVLETTGQPYKIG